MAKDISSEDRLKTATCPKCGALEPIEQDRLPVMIFFWVLAAVPSVIGVAVLAGMVKGDVPGGLLLLAMGVGTAFLGVLFSRPKRVETKCCSCGSAFLAERKRGSSGEYEWATTLVAEVKTVERPGALAASEGKGPGIKSPIAPQPEAEVMSPGAVAGRNAAAPFEHKGEDVSSHRSDRSFQLQLAPLIIMVSLGVTGFRPRRVGPFLSAGPEYVEVLLFTAFFILVLSIIWAVKAESIDPDKAVGSAVGWLVFIGVASFVAGTLGYLKVEIPLTYEWRFALGFGFVVLPIAIAVMRLYRTQRLLAFVLLFVATAAYSADTLLTILSLELVPESNGGMIWVAIIVHLISLNGLLTGLKSLAPSLNVKLF